MGFLFSGPIKRAMSIVRLSFKTVVRDPQIVIYPWLASVFTGLTFPIVSASIFHRWYSRIFSAAGTVAPHKISIIIGLVAFSTFYAAFVGAFFTCAVSASVLAKLEGRSTPPLYGLLRVLKHWFRVARFAILSVFLFPVGVFAQRGKLPKGIVGVVGSSITLHMANLAPAILSTKKSYGATVRDSIDTLGKAWQEGLVLKIAMYLVVFVIIVLPKLIQHNFFTSPKASNVGWLVSLELGATTLAGFKVMNAIFTTVLYHQAKQKMLD